MSREISDHFEDTKPFGVVFRTILIVNVGVAEKKILLIKIVINNNNHNNNNHHHRINVIINITQYLITRYY